MQLSKAAMYISPTRLLLVSPRLVADVHQHVVVQFTCSLDGKPFSVWTESDGWQKTEAVLINSNIPHSVKDFEAWQLTACIIPDAYKGRLLQKKVLEDKPVKYFSAAEVAPLVETLQATALQVLPDGRAFNSVTDAVFHFLLGEIPLTPPMDQRISDAISYIRQNIHNNISAASLASRVHLSEDRFLHLFREQVGAPLRPYILWQRLGAGIEAFISGKSAKEAAYEAGFSDPAHFSRTFQQLFGGLPSDYTALKSQYHFAFFYDL